MNRVYKNLDGVFFVYYVSIGTLPEKEGSVMSGSVFTVAFATFSGVLEAPFAKAFVLYGSCTLEQAQARIKEWSQDVYAPEFCSGTCRVSELTIQNPDGFTTAYELAIALQDEGCEVVVLE